MKMIFFSAFAMMVSFAGAQVDPNIDWQRTIGADQNEVLSHFSKTDDGAYVLAGYTDADASGFKTENSYGESDYWLVVLNLIGDVVLEKTYGGNSFDILTAAAKSEDGGYFLLGYSQSDMSPQKSEDRIGLRDYWLVKLNSFGDLVWENTIGGTDDDWSADLQSTADGGCLIGGYSRSNVSGDKTQDSYGGSYDYWVLKVDNEGDIEWDKTIGGNGEDRLMKIIASEDGGYLLGGTSSSDASFDKSENSIGSNDYWVVKINAVGDIEWENTIGGSDGDNLTAMIQTADEKYVIGGESWSNMSGDKTENAFGALATDFWVVKLTGEGVIEWDRSYGGTDFDKLTSISEMENGDLLLGGESTSDASGNKSSDNNGDYDYWIIRTSSDGSIIWDNNIGGEKSDRFINAFETNVNEIIMAGYSSSGISGDKSEERIGEEEFNDGDFWVVKLSPVISNIIEASNGIPDVSVYPNPSDQYLFVDIADMAMFEILSLQGETLIKSENQPVDIQELSAGTYILRVRDLQNTIVFTTPIVRI